MPVPARITMALDLRQLYGPDVDIACGTWEGNPAGDVDAWEAGTHSPTDAQVELLAVLTEFPPAFFYRPCDEKETTTFICDRRRRGENALTVIHSHVDYDGVLRREQLTPDRPPYRPRPAKSDPSTPATSPARRPLPAGVHEPVEDPTAPGCCTCGVPMDRPNRRHPRTR